MVLVPNRIVWYEWLTWRYSPVWLCGEPCLWFAKFLIDVHYEIIAFKMWYLQKCVAMGISPFPLISRLPPSKREAWGMNVDNYHPTSLTNLSPYNSSMSLQYWQKFYGRETNYFWTSTTFQCMHHPQDYSSISQITVIFGKVLKQSPKNKAILLPTALSSLPTYMNKYFYPSPSIPTYLYKQAVSELTKVNQNGKLQDPTFFSQQVILIMCNQHK